MLRHVAGLAEIVEDVNQAVAFYRDVMGLQLEQQNGDDYAMFSVPGVLHFGVWNRAHAAESVFGSRERAADIPLGFTMEFETETLEVAEQHIRDSGAEVSQSARVEPWGQKTMRMLSPGGSLLGFAETPWARQITQQLEVAQPEKPSHEDSE